MLDLSEEPLEENIAPLSDRKKRALGCWLGMKVGDESSYPVNNGDYFVNLSCLGYIGDSH